MWSSNVERCGEPLFARSLCPKLRVGRPRLSSSVEHGVKRRRADSRCQDGARGAWRVYRPVSSVTLYQGTGKGKMQL